MSILCPCGVSAVCGPYCAACTPSWRLVRPKAPLPVMPRLPKRMKARKEMVRAQLH